MSSGSGDALLDELLDVSQLMAGEVHLEKINLRIDQAVGRAVETLRPVLVMNGARVWLSLWRVKLFGWPATLGG